MQLLLDAVAFGNPPRVAFGERIDVPVPEVPGSDRCLSARLSPGPPAVKNQMGFLVGRQERADSVKSVCRYIDRAWNMTFLELVLGPVVDENEGLLLVEHLFELLNLYVPDGPGPSCRRTSTRKEHGHNRNKNVYSKVMFHACNLTKNGPVVT